jgi:hypothetical protein
MRTALIPFILLLTTSVSAQRAAHGGAAAPAPQQTQTQPQHRPSAPPPMPAAPPRTVAPPIVFPMGPLTTPPSGGLTAPVTFVPGTGTTPPRDIFLNGRRNPYRNYATPYGGYGGYGGYGSYATEPNATSASQAPPGPAVVGFLRVSGTPSEAQIFVDGYFVGTLADVEAGRPLMIDAGPHRLELRAPGYQSTSVDIRLAPNDTLTYRAALDRVQPPLPPARTTASAAASTMYLIPNCYLGNVPPRANRLSPGCDIKQVQVLGAK